MNEFFQENSYEKIFACESVRTGLCVLSMYYRSVTFKNIYLFRLWVQSVLDVALSHNAEVSDDFDGSVPQHVVFVVV